MFFISKLPSWIKNNAKWWSDGWISDEEFLKAIQYLVSNGVINLDFLFTVRAPITIWNLRHDQVLEGGRLLIILSKLGTNSMVFTP